MVAPKSASTVIFLNEGYGSGLRVLMLKRNIALEFVGGAYVFPGGKVDDGDKSPKLYSRCVGVDDEEASSRLGVHEDGLSYYIAAIRESFEEAGVFLGSANEDKGMLDVTALYEKRKELNAGQVAFETIIEELNLELHARRLIYFAHWITPEGSPRRYDTRFFISALPKDQVADVDYGETTSSVWISPKEALERHHQGEFEMILPTVKSLEVLSQFSSIEETLKWASSERDIPAITPKLVHLDGGVEILLPDHPLYDSSAEVFLRDTRDLPT